MASVFAGFVVGYALSLAIGPIAAVVIIRSNQRSGVAQRIAPPGTSVIALSVVLHFAAIMLLTAIGLLLGIVLNGLEQRRSAGGLGSPNIAYTLLVLASAAVVVIPALAVPSIRRYALCGAIVFAVSFGWAMPWLAKLG
ncbi:MAG: hypothetical protein M3P30_13100 [Chloroflexota bacterium]|nr:hypothetical protein [Chloroflexota bacterium]